MEKEFIPYEEALALKELGFNEPCLSYWYNETPRNPEGQCIVYYKKPWNEQKIINGIIRDYYVAPTYSQAFRWFREKYHYVSYIRGRKSMGFEYILTDVPTEKTKYDTVFSEQVYDTHEEAELACLKKLIEIIKNK